VEFSPLWFKWSNGNSSRHQKMPKLYQILAAIANTHTLARKNARLVISFIDHLEENRTLNALELALRKTVIFALHRTLREKLAYWRQHGKIKAAIDGDENSKYFHVCASNRYQKNRITLLSH
jgi:hypothetical protein